jgi:hypothetical protein
MKLNSTLVLLSLLLPSISWAGSCQGEKNGLIASYELDTFSYSESTETGTDSTTPTHSAFFNFIRKNNNLVSYQYPQMGISKSWFRTKNQRVNSVHYFDKFNRAIEYDNADLPKGSNDNWDGMYPMISKTFLNTMDSKATTDDCEITFKHKKGGQSWDIVWSESLNLPIEMTHISKHKKTILKLKYFKNDMQAVVARLEALSAYQSTDYADIGDNESDPFLRKMIRLGFVKHEASGFYDAQGNAQKQDGHAAHTH